MFRERVSDTLGWTVSPEEGSLWPRGLCEDLEEAVLELDLEGSIGLRQVDERKGRVLGVHSNVCKMVEDGGKC